LRPGLEDAYAETVKGLVERYYTTVSRYTGSSFLRGKLGDALHRRGSSPYIFENAQEARNARLA
jgi:propionate CoA-transferase